MGVQLRVISPARRLAEHRHRQPAGLGMQSAAVGTDTGRRGVLLDHRHRGVHGDVVALGETSSPVRPHSTDNDFGADNVAS